MKKLFYFVMHRNDHSEIIESETRPKMASEGGTIVSLSPGYNTLEELKEEYEIADTKCSICGEVYSTYFMEPMRKRLIEKNICFTCNHWEEWAEKKDNPRIARIDHNHYYIESESAGKLFRGFAGHRFKILFNDGREVVTTNLWHQGEIPEHFWEKLPDNAKFVV